MRSKILQVRHLCMGVEILTLLLISYNNISIRNVLAGISVGLV